jgi:hypothetical protein
MPLFLAIICIFKETVFLFGRKYPWTGMIKNCKNLHSWAPKMSSRETPRHRSRRMVLGVELAILSIRVCLTYSL